MSQSEKDGILGGLDVLLTELQAKIEAAPVMPNVSLLETARAMKQSGLSAIERLITGEEERAEVLRNIYARAARSKGQKQRRKNRRTAMLASGKQNKMKLGLVTGVAIVWMSVFLSPIHASPTVLASKVFQTTGELNHGDRIGLSHAETIIPKLFSTHDVIGLFARYVGLDLLDPFEEALRNYATRSAKKGDWQSFRTAIQLHTDILDRLASLVPPNKVKEETGVIHHANEITLDLVLSLTAGVNAEHFVIYDVMHAQANRVACLGILDSRLKEMDEMGHHCLLHYQAHGGIFDLTKYRRKIHQDLQQIRPLLTASVTCLASGHDRTAGRSH